MSARQSARGFAAWSCASAIQVVHAIHVGGAPGLLSLVAAGVAALAARVYYRRIP